MSSSRVVTPNNHKSSHYLVAASDTLIVAAIGMVAFYVLFDDESVAERYALATAAFTIIVVLCNAALGLYDGRRPLFSWNVFRRLVIAWFVVMASIALIAVVTKSNYTYSRAWFLSTAGLSFLCSLAIRILFNIRARAELRDRAAKSDVLAIGRGENFNSIVEEIASRAPFPFNRVETWDWQYAEQKESEPQLSDIDAKAKELNLKQIWVIGRGLDQRATNSIVTHFNSELTELTYFPDFSYLPVVVPQVENVGRLAAISLSAKPLSVADGWLKAGVDKVFAFCVLTLLSPFLLLIAAGVKLSSPGPVFFRQQRLTLNGVVFEMLKFRSMPVDAEATSGPVWAKKGESRATKFGTFLRRSSLDELPQFINVLKGEMSVVGPRPERPFFVEEFQKSVPAYMQKHYVRAGITGWAQVNGLRGNTSIEKRIEYDIFYIQNWSIWLDFKIIFITIFKGFLADTAY